MIYFIEIPHQRAASMWAAEDWTDAATKSGFQDADPELHPEIEFGYAVDHDGNFTGRPSLRVESITQWIGRDLNSLIVIETISDLKFARQHYDGHQRLDVHALASELDGKDLVQDTR